MLQANFKNYTLQFSEKRGTSRGYLHAKKSWFIIIQDDTNPNIKGIGECSYLKGLNPENFDTYEDKIKEVCTTIDRYEYWLNEGLSAHPSIHFGLEMALKDLANGGQRILFESDFSMKNQPIAINGLIWLGDYDYMLNQVKTKVAEDYRCIKLKIGGIDFEEELRLIKELRDLSKDVVIKLDANGAFSPNEALEKLEQLAAYEIHSIEQPIRQNQEDVMAKICQQTPIPIALDEELIGHYTLKDKAALLSKIQPQYIILKPSLIGGFKGSNEWISLAENNNIDWWITSALESNIGLNAIAQFVATKNNFNFQGLGTGQLFDNNISSPLYIEKDCIYYDSKKSWALNNLL